MSYIFKEKYFRWDSASSCVPMLARGELMGGPSGETGKTEAPSQQVCYGKDPSQLKGPEFQALQPFTGNGCIFMSERCTSGT
jgi:hypothetical protein